MGHLIISISYYLSPSLVVFMQCINSTCNAVPFFDVPFHSENAAQWNLCFATTFHLWLGWYLFRGPAVQTVGLSVSFTIETNRVSLAEWTILVRRSTQITPNGPATQERKANARMTSRHWVLILSSLHATPERKITQLSATSQAKSLSLSRWCG